MFTYHLQYPRINYPIYEGKILTPDVKNEKEFNVDTYVLPTTHSGFPEFPGAPYIPAAVSAMWLSLVLNSAQVRRRLLNSVNFLDVWPTDHSLNQELDNNNINTISLWDIWQYIQFKYPFVILKKITTWNQIIVAVAEGLTVMVGGSIYESFTNSFSSGVVPMPKPGEGLLGGHIFNVVSLNLRDQTARLAGNLGPMFGKNGLLYVRTSYLRNIDINRDFFVLTAESRVS